MLRSGRQRRHERDGKQHSDSCSSDNRALAHAHVRPNILIKLYRMRPPSPATASCGRRSSRWQHRGPSLPAARTPLRRGKTRPVPTCKHFFNRRILTARTSRFLRLLLKFNARAYVAVPQPMTRLLFEQKDPSGDCGVVTRYEAVVNAEKRVQIHSNAVFMRAVLKSRLDVAVLLLCSMHRLANDRTRAFLAGSSAVPQLPAAAHHRS